MAKAKAEKSSKAPLLSLQTVEVKLIGIRPLLMRSGDMVDPLNKFTQAIKAITKQKRGSDNDDNVRQKARLEFEGGMWRDEKGLPCVPADAIEKMLVEGGRLTKMGKSYERVVRCPQENIPLIYAGMENVKRTKDLLDQFDKDPASVSLRKRVVMAGVGKTSVTRTRPRFFPWSLEFQLSVLTGLDVSFEHVRGSLELAGLVVGLGDWHGKYGLFHVDKFKY